MESEDFVAYTEGIDHDFQVQDIYDNRSTMQREVWWVDHEKGKPYMASAVSASAICQKRNGLPKGISSTWGTYPDNQTQHKEGDV